MLRAQNKPLCTQKDQNDATYMLFDHNEIELETDRSCKKVTDTWKFNSTTNRWMEGNKNSQGQLENSLRWMKIKTADQAQGASEAVFLGIRSEKQLY